MKLTNRLTAIIIFSIALLLYGLTAYPSVTWWDSAEYSMAAACMGLSGAPGSIVLTFCGWVLSLIAGHHPAYVFNLFAATMAALTVFLSLLIFKKILSMAEGGRKRDFTIVENTAFILVSGMIICSTTLWEYAVMFTPYILTPVFTLLILISVLLWWKKADEKTSWKSLFLVTLVLGIDFSVHRTNAVLIPGIVFIMLIRRPATFLNYRSYLAALAGVILGLSLQLLYIPMSLHDPAFNLGETNNLSSLWSFISLERHGGNFLMDVLVRKGPLWSYQVPYYFKGFVNNFFYFERHTIILGYLPALLGLIGMVYLFRTNRKLAIALISFFIISIASAIIYFNLPENYFRTIYRHYLPSYILFSVFIFIGAFSLMQSLGKLSPGRKRILAPVIMLLFVAISVSQYVTNIKIRDCSRNNFAVEYSLNVFRSLDKNGIYFSLGDNDYFPEAYLQVAEKERTDLIICPKVMLNLGWYVKQVQRHNPAFPFSGAGIDLNRYYFENWKTQHASIPLNDQVKKAYNTQLDTVHFSMPALGQYQENYLADLVMYDLIKTNKWERPVYFYAGINFNDPFFKWIQPYLCYEGLVYKLVPDTSLKVNIPVIEKNLEDFMIRGYNDKSVGLDNVTKEMATFYYYMFTTVIENKVSAGDKISAARYLRQMKELLPFERLQPDENIIKAIKAFEQRYK